MRAGILIAEGEGCGLVPNLVAKVTMQKGAEHDRFQCSDLYQLWDNGEVTVDHCIEDLEWGGVAESRETAGGKSLPEDFFKAGCSRVIDHEGAVREEPL